MGKVLGVCISRERGTAKRKIGEGYFQEGYGLEGDAHAGTPREVTLLMGERMQRFSREHGWELTRETSPRTSSPRGSTSGG